MKHIIFSTYDDIKNPNYGGGGARAIHEIAKRLSKKFDVTVISWNHSSIRNEVIDSVKYERIGFEKCNPKLGNLLFQIMLPVIAVRRSYDMWIESFGPPFTTSFLPLFTRKPVVGIVHMLSSEDMRRKYKISVKWIESLGLRMYSHIVVTSNNLKSTVKQISSKSKITVIGNGIPSVWQGSANTKNNFLFLGRIEVDQKGLDLLIEAFTIFKEKDKKDFNLIIAGFGSKSEENSLKKLIDQSQHKGSISFLGRVEGVKRHNLYKSSYCVVVPSRFETFSMVSLEALSYGKPVIAFSIKGLSWIPQNMSLKVKPYRVQMFARAMTKISKDKNFVSRVSITGRDFARDFTWDALAEKYISLINTYTK